MNFVERREKVRAAIRSTHWTPGIRALSLRVWALRHQKSYRWHFFGSLMNFYRNAKFWS